MEGVSGRFACPRDISPCCETSWLMTSNVGVRVNANLTSPQGRHVASISENNVLWWCNVATSNVPWWWKLLSTAACTVNLKDKSKQ